MPYAAFVFFLINTIANRGVKIMAKANITAKTGFSRNICFNGFGGAGIVVPVTIVLPFEKTLCTLPQYSHFACDRIGAGSGPAHVWH